MGACGLSDKVQEVTELIKRFGYSNVNMRMVQAEMKAQGLTDNDDARDVAMAVMEVWGSKITSLVLTKKHTVNRASVETDDADRLEASDWFVNVREESYTSKYPEGKYEREAKEAGVAIYDSAAQVKKGQVAFVQIDASTDVNGTLARIREIVKSGGRVALKDPKTVTSDAVAKKWNAIVSAMRKENVGHSYSSTGSCYVFSKGVSISELSDDERMAIEGYEAEAGDREMSINGVFNDKYKKTGSVTGDFASQFDMVYDGAVTSVAKRIYDTDYSQWRPGDIFKVKRTKGGAEDVIYCRVTSNERLSPAEYDAKKDELSARTGIHKDSLSADGHDVAVLSFEVVAKDKRIGDTGALKAGDNKNRKRKGKGKYKAKRVYRKNGRWYSQTVRVDNKNVVNELKNLNDTLLAMARAQGLDVTNINEEIESMRAERAEQAKADAKEKKKLEVDMGFAKDRSLFEFDPLDTEVNRDKLVDIFGSNAMAKDFIECFAEMVLYELDSKENYVANLREEIESSELRVEEMRKEMAQRKVSIDDEGQVLIDDYDGSADAADEAMRMAKEYVELKANILRARARMTAIQESGTISDLIRDPEVLMEAIDYIKDEISYAAWAYEAAKHILDTHQEIDEINGKNISSLPEEAKIKEVIKQLSNETSHHLSYKYNLTKLFKEEVDGGDENFFSGTYWNMYMTNVDLHNGMAEIVDDEELWKSCVSRAMQVLSRKVGAVLRVSEEGEMKSEDQETVDMEGEAVEEQEMQEEAEREGYSIEVGTVRPMKTMLQKVRNSMYTIQSYVKDKNGEWVPEVSSHFGNTRYVNVTKVNATLLKLLYDCEDSNEMMSRLESMQNVIPWLKGVLDMLREDPNMKTAYYVSFKKGRLNMRVFRTSVTKSNDTGVMHTSSWGSNYGEDELSVTTGMRSNIQGGIILNRDKSCYTSAGATNMEGGKALSDEIDDTELPAKEQVGEWIRNDANLKKLIGWLQGVGVDIPSEDQIRRAVELVPETFLEAIDCIYEISTAARDDWSGPKTAKRPRHRPLYSLTYQHYTKLGGLLSMISEDNYDNMSVEHHKSRYGYANPNAVDMMAENVGGSEDRFNRFIEERYLPVDEDGKKEDSFFYDEIFGVMNGWLRDMIDSPAYRKLFAKEHQKFIVSDDKEYQEWTRNDITRMKLRLFLSPMGKRHLNINRKDFDREAGNDGKPMAMYLMPIMADSKNFITLPGRAFVADKYDDFVDRELLDRFVDVVFQEFKRIGVSKKAGKNGDNLGVYEKNSGKFMFFPELNDGPFLGKLTGYANEGNTEGMRDYVRDVLRNEILPERVRQGLVEMENNGFFKQPFYDDESQTVGLYNSYREMNFSLVGAFRRIIEAEDRGQQIEVSDWSTTVWNALTEADRAFAREMCEPLGNMMLYANSEEGRKKAIEERKAKVDAILNTLNDIVKASQDANLTKWTKMLIDDLNKGYEKIELRKNEKGQMSIGHGGEYLKITQDRTEKTRYLNDKNIWTLTQYLLNNMYAQTQIIQLTIGDPANCKSEEDFTKRFKQYVAAYQRLDIEAEWDGQKVLDHSKPDWDCERALYIKDLKARQDASDSGEYKRLTGFYNISEYWNETVIPALEAAIRRGELSTDEVKMIVDGYADMNIADGQSFRHPASYRKMMIMSGEWTEAKEEAYKKIMSGNATFKDITVAFQSRKPFVNSYEWATKEGVYTDDDGRRQTYKYKVKVPVQYKNSEFMLFAMVKNMAQYSGSENSVLAGIAKLMDERDIDVVHFTSVVKQGEFNSMDISQCANADDVVSSVGKQLDELKARVDRSEASHDGIHRTKYSDYGIIMSTPPHLEDTEQGIGTQIRKLVLCDMPLKFNGKDTRVIMRDAEENVLSDMSAKEYKRKYNSILIEKLRRSYIEVAKQFEDKTELIKLIRNSVLGTDRYSREVINAIELDENGEFRMPLDYPALAGDIENILTSYIKKHIVKQTTRGGTAYQVSSVGFSRSLKPETETVNGVTRVKNIPCLLPIWAKSIFRCYMDEEGNVDINRVPDEMRRLIGYRVPTEYMYSMVPLKVVGFSNQANGSAIILPQEIVSWSGSDFDIDKMFLMIPDFKVPKKPVRSITDNENLEMRDGRIRVKTPRVRQAFDNAYGRHRDLQSKAIENRDSIAIESLGLEANAEEEVKRKIKEWRDQGWQTGGPGIDRETFEAFEARLDEMKRGRQLYEFLGDEEANIIKSKVQDELRKVYENGTYMHYELEYVKPSYDKDVSEMTDTELNNTLINMMYGRLTSDFSYWQNQRVGGFLPQKRQSRIMSILKNADEAWLLQRLEVDNINSAYIQLNNMGLDELTDIARESEKKYSYSDPMMFEKFHEQNMTGATMIGIFALANANQALLQDTDVSVSDDLTNHFNISINGSRRQSLHEIYDERGQSIIANTAGFLAASVDNAKDPLLEAMNMVPETADIGLALLRLGYSLDTVMLIMNSPCVVSAVRQLKQAKENRDLEVPPQLSDYITRQPQSGDLTTEALLEDIITNKVDLKTNNYKRTPTQLNVMAVVSYALKVAEQLMNLTNVMKVDSTSNSIQKTIGETYTREKAAAEFHAKNEWGILGSDGKYRYIDILDNISNIGNQFFFSDPSAIPTTEDYLKRYFDESKEGRGVPMSQAWYDFGLRMGRRLAGKMSYKWGGDTSQIMNELNAMTFKPGAQPLGADVCTLMAEELVYYRTCMAFKDKNDPRSFKEQREAYLRSFPSHFIKVLEKKQEEGVNLKNKYLILSMLEYDSTNGEIRFQRLGRIDKDMTEELMASWEQMLTDEDQDVVSLAMSMCVYSAFRDGFEFGYYQSTIGRTDALGNEIAWGDTVSGGTFGYLCPVAVLEQFPDYIQALRDLRKPMSASERTKFEDQFIRAHIRDKSMKPITGRVMMLKEENDRFSLENVICIPDSKSGKGSATKKFKGVKDRFTVFDNAPWELRKKFVNSSAYNDYRQSSMKHYKQYIKVKFNGQTYFYRLESQTNDNLEYVRVSELDRHGYDPETGYDASFVNLTYASLSEADLTSGTSDESDKKDKVDPQVIISSEQTNAIKAELAMQEAKKKVRNLGTVDSNGVEHNDREFYEIEVSPGNVVKALRVHSVLGSLNPLNDPNISESAKKNMKRAMDVGSAVDTVLRDYFANGAWNSAPLETTLAEQGYSDPSGMAEGLFDSAVEFAQKYSNCKLLTDNITTWIKRSDINGYVAGEVDMLMRKPDGTYALVDFKTSGNPRSLIDKEIVELNDGSTINNKELHRQYEMQLQVYKKMLENQYGITINETNILFIQRTRSSLRILDPVSFEANDIWKKVVDRKLQVWSDDSKDIKAMKKLQELSRKYLSEEGVKKADKYILDALESTNTWENLQANFIKDVGDSTFSIPSLVSSIKDKQKKEKAIKEFKAIFDDFGDKVC